MNPSLLRAIGLIRLDLVNNRASAELAIRSLAERDGYSLAGILDIAENTYMPTTLVVSTAQDQRASVLLALSLDHFGGAEHALSTICKLVTPTETVPRNQIGRRGTWIPQ